ncbi:DUF3298 domain-containing protein [Chitinophaga sp. MM2321]|uniref:DUF3298 and DUF4163 domain-containing protein n=1 Tax=Chitinophaga sp. MM2321 TaxID=3137178 RepID=UPI0032D56C23
MKRVLLLLLLTAGALLSCHNNDHAKDGDTTDSLIVPLASTPYFYTQLKGAVGGKHITMQLLKTAPHLYRGYYCYDSIGLPISIWGSQDSDSDEVKIYEDNGNSEEERFFSGRLTDDGQFKGVWHGDRTSWHFALHTDLKKAVPLLVYYSTDSARLSPSRPQSPMGVASNSIIWPDSTVDPAIAAFIKKEVTGNPVFTDPQQYVKRAIDSFIRGYQLTAKDADSNELNDMSQSASWNWTAENDIKVVWNTWPLLVLEKYTYDFTGGAHGNWGNTYKTLDLSKLKVLTPEDIFKPGYKETLSPLLDKAFRKKFNIAEDEALDQNLLVKTIPPNNNIIVTDKGVAFSYVPYEIGPYALGQVTLYIPFTELSKDLRK